MVDTSTVAQAVKWIASSLIKEAKYLYGVQGHVRKLQSDLESMLDFLHRVDANPSKNANIRIFTREIRVLAFRAEDAIETYLVEIKSKIYNNKNKNIFSKVATLASLPYAVHTLRTNIEAIQKEIQDARGRFDIYDGILPNPSQRGNASTSRHNPENYIHLDQVVVGIDGDINRLVKRLANPKDDFKVLAIVGTGGAGKTTLATQIYRHTQVASWFSCKAFVSVSQEWSSSDLHRRIWNQVKGNTTIPSSAPELVRALHGFLKDKQCLVVLDDIWTKEAWDDVYPIIPQSCRVVFTTRNEEVAFYADNRCIIHRPQLLTEDQKWELFSKVAMEGRQGIENNPEYENLGKQMLEKCKGLPLAIITLAGILKVKQELYQWENINKAYVEYILEGKGAPNYGVVEDMLKLSFFDLPTYLKPCFLYLAVFPEDFEIDTCVLIQMWIAEGFIIDDLQRTGETLEDAAMHLLEELAQRCIIQITQRSFHRQIEKFHMHDLMRELCIKMAKEYHFLEMIPSTHPDERESSQSRRRESSQSRRISISSRDYDRVESQQLRTLLYFGIGDDGAYMKLRSVTEKFKLLRVLHIGGISGVDLSEQIGNLIHLRYLFISLKENVEIPGSIRNLRNLLYFEYHTQMADKECGPELPNDLVSKMGNLRGLVLPSSLMRRDFNMGFRGPKNLLSLSSGAGPWMYSDLRALSRTVQHLKISDVLDNGEMSYIYFCPSIREDRLRTLTCCSSVDQPNTVKFELNRISHCKTLRCLDLNCSLELYSPYKESRWNLVTPELRTPCIEFPPNLVTLELTRSEIKPELHLMQVLGDLSKLKSLSLWNNAYLGAQLICTATSFPQLHKLSLCGLNCLEEWSMEDGAMPRLTKLEISYCLKLKRLPPAIRSITAIKELSILDMPREFCKKLQGGQISTDWGEDYGLIQHIPSITVKPF